MASLTENALSYFKGRNTIGLMGVGIDGNSFVTVDLNLVSAFSVTKTVSITKHPIELDTTRLKSLTKITDNVSPESSIVTIACILSDTISLDFGKILSFKPLSIKSIKDKLKTLSYWQRTGSVLSLLGYTTDGNDFGVGSLSNYLDRGLSSLADSKIEESFYIGTSTDEIEHVVLGNLTHKESEDLGTDIECGFSLERIQIAIATTTNQRNYVKPKNTKIEDNLKEGIIPDNRTKLKQLADKSRGKS